MGIGLLLQFFALLSAQEAKTDKGKLLFDWIKNNGGYVSPKIELSTGPNPQEWSIRGIFAKENLERTEKLAVIPKEVAICATEGAEYSDCDVALKIMSEMEKGEASFYWPYLQILEDHRPIVFTERETPLLEDLPPYDFLPLQAKVGLCGLDSSPASLQILALVWARLMSIDNRSCMVPLWDNFNHHRVSENLMWGKDPLTLYASQDIGQGSQAWSHFNQRTPTLFSTYGFVEPLPNTWFFDGNDGTRYYFDLSEDGIEIHPIDGEQQDIVNMKIQLRKILSHLRAQESDFQAAAVAYAGSSETLALISSYRAAFKRALELAAVGLQNHFEL